MHSDINLWTRRKDKCRKWQCQTATVIPDSPALLPHASCTEARERVKEKQRDTSVRACQKAPGGWKIQ